jgi:hypothetical protein
LPNDKEITWPVSNLPRSDLFLKIDAHNSIEKHIRTARFQIGILIDYDLIIRTLNNDRCPAFGQPDGKTLCLFQDRLELLPGAWQSISMRFSAKGKGPRIEYGLFSAVLRLFSEDGVADFPFRIAVVEKDQT